MLRGGSTIYLEKKNSEEMVEGRSPGGQKTTRGEVRPALEDRAKLNFLEDFTPLSIMSKDFQVRQVWT